MVAEAKPGAAEAKPGAVDGAKSDDAIRLPAPLHAPPPRRSG
jgi:hypothetical protein